MDTDINLDCSKECDPLIKPLDTPEELKGIFNIEVYDPREVNNEFITCKLKTGVRVFLMFEEDNKIFYEERVHLVKPIDNEDNRIYGHVI